jgi:hypothetical protein
MTGTGWIPVFTGMTKKEEGMTKEGVMTKGKRE